MQISTARGYGTVSITNNTNRAIGSSAANWIDVAAGDEFAITGSISKHNIANVYPPGTVGNTTPNMWELTIVGVFGEATQSGSAYAIAIDFYSASGMCIPQLGDTMTLQFLRRNFDYLDSMVGSIGGSYQAIAISAAGNTNSTQSKTSHAIKATVAAGAGAYTATISLLTRSEGDRCSILFDIAATPNPKVQVFNGSPAGTKLFEWDNSTDGTATKIACEFVYGGGAWYLHNAQFIQ